MSLKVKILSPIEPLYEGEAKSLLAPSVKGETEILPSHASYVTSLEPGEIKVNSISDGQKTFSVTGGFCQVNQDEVIVLAEVA